MPKTLDIRAKLNPDFLAEDIVKRWETWGIQRQQNDTLWAEIRNYVFATDTTTTTNAKLPWKNKTTRPKLCQIRDNLHANYIAALFPNDRWFKWDAQTEEAAAVEKANAIRAYLSSKMREAKFKEIVSRLVYDYIDYGNVFAEVEYVEDDAGFTGPRPVRLSPHDIRFDLTAPSFRQAPKIVRTLLSLGDIKKRMATDSVYRLFKPEVIKKVEENRAYFTGTSHSFSTGELAKMNAFKADGFATFLEYMKSGMVEVLEFEGDLYDISTGTYHTDKLITVIDRMYILSDRDRAGVTGRSNRHHCGWRLRPDNLMAMGPLDNLVGMQYRIDHLENLRADVFDLIANPPLKVKGLSSDDFRFGPNERIYLDEDGDVTFLVPDTTALQADFQIRELEAQMEEMAGAPREAAGFRTPGEKTAFEVNALQSAANRIFLNKIAYFEEHFLEPILNSMLELARINITMAEEVPVTDSEFSYKEFLKVSEADLRQKGLLVPLGARHFAAQAQLIQNLTQLSATGLYNDPAVSAHISGFKIAKLIEENLGLTDYMLVSPNIRVTEQAETQQLVNTATDQTDAAALMPTPEEMPDDDDTGEDELEGGAEGAAESGGFPAGMVQ